MYRSVFASGANKYTQVPADSGSDGVLSGENTTIFFWACKRRIRYEAAAKMKGTGTLSSWLVPGGRLWIPGNGIWIVHSSTRTKRSQWAKRGRWEWTKQRSKTAHDKKIHRKDKLSASSRVESSALHLHLVISRTHTSRMRVNVNARRGKNDWSWTQVTSMSLT
jgi:hypothetical protein